MTAAHHIPPTYARLMAIFDEHEVIRRAILDPYILLDKDLRIVLCNEMFTEMAGAETDRDLVGQCIGDILNFEVQGKELPMDHIFTPTPIRLDEIQLKTSYSKPGKSKGKGGGIIIIGSLPLRDGDELVGYFTLIRDVTQESSLQGEYERKFQMSVTDVLTGMRNRAFLQQFLQTQFGLYQASLLSGTQKQSGQSFCVLMSDIDHFKKINDTYGHQAGDFVLKNIAQVISQSVRKTDIVCRYGGEEFLVTFVNMPEHAASAVAEKIRANIQAAVITFEGKTIPVTSSFGMSMVKPVDTSIDDVVKRADAALYASKRSGRNRVTKD